MILLPNELIIQILSDLTHRDLIACLLSNKKLYSTIKDSVVLQFRIASSTFKIVDNPSCPLSVAKRLKALKDTENAWTYLRKDFTRRIDVNYETSGYYDLSAGVFLLGNDARTALHYIKLPSSAQDNSGWQMIQLNQSQGMILDTGFCLYEHDMLVVVTRKPNSSGFSAPRYDISLVLFKLSTGEPHPDAKESTIQVLDSEWDWPEIWVEVVGDRLVLILSYHHSPGRPDDRVFIYDWRNAALKMSFMAPWCSYSGLVFLSEKLIVIPNARTSALEIWDIFSTTETPPRPACILQLPELVLGNLLDSITCRGEPNPIGSGSRRQSDKPFFYAADEAIILFQIRVLLGDPETQQQHGGDFVFGYTLFVHRKALCEIYERRSTNTLGDPLGMPDVHVQVEDNTIVDDDESDGWESVESETGDNAAVRAINDDLTPIPWPSWGPPITTWLPATADNTRWITTSAGQRAVFVGHSQHEIAREYIVLDFNIENVLRAEKELASLPEGVESRLHCVRNTEGVKIEGIFKEDSIVGELPFVARGSEGVYPWNGALMDEERILGLMVETEGSIKIIEVHHFGGAQS